MVTQVAAAHAFWACLAKEQVFHDRVNPFYRFNDKQFKQRFRINKDTVDDLLIMLLPELYRSTGRSHALPESLQLCVALRFLADGCYILTCADTVHISESSVH